MASPEGKFSPVMKLLVPTPVVALYLPIVPKPPVRVLPDG
jgi:hypothetical protein